MGNAKLVENIKETIKRLKYPNSAVVVFHEDETFTSGLGVSTDYSPRLMNGSEIPIIMPQ